MYKVSILKVDQFTITQRSEQSITRLNALAGGFLHVEAIFLMPS